MGVERLVGKMTENEEIKGLMFLKEKLYNGIYADRLGCIDYAISEIKEVQRYREIGTLEEFREAVEKQKPKKPEVSDSDFDYYKCPICGAYIWATDCVYDHNYCLNCGQAIDWEERE